MGTCRRRLTSEDCLGVCRHHGRRPKERLANHEKTMQLTNVSSPAKHENDRKCCSDNAKTSPYVRLRLDFNVRPLSHLQYFA